MRAVLTYLILAIWLAGAALPTGAEQTLYRQVDRDGNVTWSDRPAGEASRPPPPRIISMPGPSARESPKTGERASSAPFVPYRRMALEGPEYAVSAARGSSGIAVRLALSPPLKSGHRVRLRVGDRVAQSALAATTLMAVGLAPGRHRLVAELIDASGVVRQRSSALRLDIRP